MTRATWLVGLSLSAVAIATTRGQERACGPVPAPSSAAPASSRDRGAIARWVLRRQNRDGSFGKDHQLRFQTTALVLSGLCDQRLPAGELEAARGRAAEFLIAHQDERGAFFDHGQDRTLLGVVGLLMWRDGAPPGSWEVVAPLLGDPLRHAVLDGTAPALREPGEVADRAAPAVAHPAPRPGELCELDRELARAARSLLGP